MDNFGATDFQATLFGHLPCAQLNVVGSIGARDRMHNVLDCYQVSTLDLANNLSAF